MGKHKNSCRDERSPSPARKRQKCHAETEDKDLRIKCLEEELRSLKNKTESGRSGSRKYRESSSVVSRGGQPPKKASKSSSELIKKPGDKRLSTPHKTRGERSPSLINSGESSPLLSQVDDSERSLSPVLRRDSSPSLSNTSLNKVDGDEDIIDINNNVDILTDETLEALGEDPNKVKQKSFILHEVIKTRWQNILANGMDKSDRSELLEKHTIPENLALLKAPEVNAEIAKAIPIEAYNKDKFQKLNQNQLGKGLSAIGFVLNTFLRDESMDKERKNIILGALSEAGKNFSDVHYNMSISRRAVITPLLGPSVRDIIKQSPVEELPFGAELTEKLKLARAVEKSALDLKETKTPLKTFKRPQVSQAQPSTSGTSKKQLNYRGQSGSRRNPRPQGRYPQQSNKYRQNYRK